MQANTHARTHARTRLHPPPQPPAPLFIPTLNPHTHNTAHANPHCHHNSPDKQGGPWTGDHWYVFVVVFFKHVVHAAPLGLSFQAVSHCISHRAPSWAPSHRSLGHTPPWSSIFGRLLALQPASPTRHITRWCGCCLEIISHCMTHAQRTCKACAPQVLYGKTRETLIAMSSIAVTSSSA
jgi:hypothetical protein